ncbi:MAG TPA: DUF1207 domain-containing protein [Planctomycetaceae bacterium]|jgi:hypothetical protein|nr:DUF1207 domain-containing protein [Planctomycetaceae bacterium]
MTAFHDFGRLLRTLVKAASVLLFVPGLVISSDSDVYRLLSVRYSEEATDGIEMEDISSLPSPEVIDQEDLIDLDHARQDWDGQILSGDNDPIEWRVLPAGLMYRSYLAGEKESRFQFVPLADLRRGLIWETALGGRTGLLRYGTRDALKPQGWQLDLEGAVLARINPEHHDDLDAADFRAGFLSTWRDGPNAYKAGYYHLSSHVGDEFLIRNPQFDRLNYVRDSLIAGWTRDLTLDTSVYAEIALAFNYEDGAKPLELQFGTQYSPYLETGRRGAPFVAANIHVRQDFNFVTGVNVVTGWQWRGADTNHLFRTGVQLYDGPSMQYSFVNRHETLLGGGIWFDY